LAHRIVSFGIPLMKVWINNQYFITDERGPSAALIDAHTDEVRNHDDTIFPTGEGVSCSRFVLQQLAASAVSPNATPLVERWLRRE
jgi:hypothetical protein